jgi:hypothetical protein
MWSQDVSHIKRNGINQLIQTSAKWLITSFHNFFHLFSGIVRAGGGSLGMMFLGFSF